MTYEQNNDQLWSLAGVADIAFEECCLQSNGMQMDSVSGKLRMVVTSDLGISVEFEFNDDAKWTGYVAVGHGTQLDVLPQIDSLIDAIMDAKNGIMLRRTK